VKSLGLQGCNKRERTSTKGVGTPTHRGKARRYNGAGRAPQLHPGRKRRASVGMTRNNWLRDSGSVQLSCGDFQRANGDDAQAFAVGCGEDLWEGLDGAGWLEMPSWRMTMAPGARFFVTRYCRYAAGGMYQAGGCKGSFG
jgi:hypothetical protein